MKLMDEYTKPMDANYNGEVTKVRQRLQTYRISKDADMVEFAHELQKGREVILELNLKRKTYYIIRNLVPVTENKKRKPGKK